MPIKMDKQQILEQFQLHLHQDQVGEARIKLQEHPIILGHGFYGDIFWHVRSVEMLHLLTEYEFPLENNQEMFIHLIKESRTCHNMVPLLNHMKQFGFGLTSETFVMLSNVEEAMYFHRMGMNLTAEHEGKNNLHHAIQNNDIDL